MSAGLALEGRSLGLDRDGRRLLDDVSLRLAPGQLHVLLGANGAGKSTLLRLLAGELRPNRGTVELNGRALRNWTPRECACQRAVMSQFDALQADFQVADVVALGRYPCWRQTVGEEAAVIDAALSAVDAGSLAARSYLSLSGGERRRVQLARSLAQLGGPLPPTLGNLPRYLLLDEPTAGLDLAHRHAALKLARALAAEGLGVLAILHDPDLAMRYADQITLLSAGRVLAQGSPQQTLTTATLAAAYSIHAEFLPQPGSDRPAVIVRPLDSHEESSVSE